MEKSCKNYVIAIDGEAGTGKSTLAKNIALKYGIVYLDTGAMYRCVTLACINRGIEPENIDGINEVLKDITISFKKEGEKTFVICNGEDVTEEIRTPKVDSYVAKFAAIKEVRDKMTPLQREMGKTSKVVMEGRDIGTVVFPDADVKIYLDCSEEERANRRYKQNRLETQRDIAPLTVAKDARYIDTTNLGLQEVEDLVVSIIREKVEL